MPDPTAPDPSAPDAAAAAPPPSAPGMPTGDANGPGGAPMLTPQKAVGTEASGYAEVQTGVTFLMTAVKKVGGPMTKRGEALLKAIALITKEFKDVEDKGKELMPAQLMRALQGAKPPGMGAPPPGGARPGMPPPPGAM